MTRRQPDTNADIDEAARLFCDELRTVKAIRLNAHGDEVTGRYAAEKIRAAPEKQRRLVGRRLLKRYRRETQAKGPIDWQAFRVWLKEHMAEMTFLRIILSVISILLIL
jgi:hypothetical protein